MYVRLTDMSTVVAVLTIRAWTFEQANRIRILSDILQKKYVTQCTGLLVSVSGAKGFNRIFGAWKLERRLMPT
jgi:hypothetical protein